MTARNADGGLDDREHLYRPSYRRSEHQKREDFEPRCELAFDMVRLSHKAHCLLKYGSWDPENAVKDFKNRIKGHEGEFKTETELRLSAYCMSGNSFLRADRAAIFSLHQGYQCRPADHCQQHSGVLAVAGRLLLDEYPQSTEDDLPGARRRGAD